MTRKPKKPVHHVEMTEGKREIICGLLEEYDIESAQDITDIRTNESIQATAVCQSTFHRTATPPLNLRS